MTLSPTCALSSRPRRDAEMSGAIDRIRGVYAIIDPEVHGGENLSVCEAVLAAGVTAVQLRAKRMSTEDMIEDAAGMAALCGLTGAALIVNDRLDVALASGADGAHLGQDDLPLAEAREVVRRGGGEDFLIGVSTHSAAEARAAEAGGADYIGFGCMYPTGTKGDVTMQDGPAELERVSWSVRIPVIAIGGIGLGNIAEVARSKARGAAVISAICGASDPRSAAAELVRAWEENAD